MKKIFLSVLFFVVVITAFAQTNSTVDVFDEVYSLLIQAENRGFCSPLSSSRPYTEKYIIKKLDEILSHYDEESTNPEKEIVLAQKQRFERKTGFDFQHLGYRYETKFKNFPLTFEFNDVITGFVSPALYAKGAENTFGYELFNNFVFKGDIGNNVSYSAIAYIGITLMPLEFMGTYDVGYWWYDISNYYSKHPPYDHITDSEVRYVNTYKKRAVIPYSFSKYWDGNAFHFGNINAGGLEDWPTVNSMAFGMFGEIHGSFWDNKIELGISRQRREWGAMDTGASLIMNSKARPFFALDNVIHLFPFLSLSGLTGFLEFPNKEFINRNAWGPVSSDFYYFQNAFSIGQLDLDFKYFHFDFGSTVVWPKRFDLLYAFPLIDRIISQDTMGDCDNLALYANLKFRKPGLGSIWFSGYLDEMPSWNPITVLKNMFKKDRYMFAIQAGTNIMLPFFNFTSLSFRYTKIEPYCYTHQAVNYTPWYNHYISESYTNNGESLGYYLPPNSDEFFVRLETRPNNFSLVALQYQLIRHGAEFGKDQVDGSSLYSELPPGGRDDLEKHFLRDGAYEWSNIITIQGSYNFRQFKVPIMLNCTFGIEASFFTTTGDNSGAKGDYYRVENEDYKSTTGFFFTVGFTIFGR